MSDFEAILRWYVVLTLISAALLPFVSWLGIRLGPMRFGLVRPLSLVTITAIVWWPAAVFGLPFSRWTLLTALVVTASVGWGLLIRQRIGLSGLRSLFAFEALWLTTFLLYALFRSYQPDILNTEKPMEIALLSSVSLSSEVPAPDPWFAGSAINYYYFGYQMFAGVIKLSSVPSMIGFNLALATLFASCATSAAAAGGMLVRHLGGARWAAVTGATLAVVLLLLAGNLETSRRLLDDVRATIDAGWWDGVGWQASRIIYDHDVHQPGDEAQTINEFPAFSFVLGDLHPHVMTYPLLAAVLVLGLGLATSNEREQRLRLAVIGACVGLLYVSNSWDAPAGMLLVTGALAIRHRRAWKPLIQDIGLVVAGAVVIAGPFLLQFDAPVGVANSSVPDWLVNVPVVGRFATTFAFVTWHPSSLRELVVVHGAWVAAFAAFAAVELSRDRSLLHAIARRRHYWLAGGIVAFGIAMAWSPAVLLLGVPLLVSLWLAARADRSAIRVLAGVFAAGFLLALIPEFIFIQDVFANRMNTVFKLFYQAWLMFSIATAGSLVYVISQVPRRYRVPSIAAASVLVIVTLPYAPLSAQDWTNDFAVRYGLDGSTFLSRSAPDDLAAIAWIRSHAQPGDLLVEAPGCSYSNAFGAPSSRVSAFTGIPTTVGWHGHESQWRRGEYVSIGDVLNRRVDEANAILNGRVAPDDTDVRFVILGRQERLGSPNCSLAVPRERDPEDALRSSGWELAFRHGEMAIFARPDDPSVANSR